MVDAGEECLEVVCDDPGFEPDARHVDGDVSGERVRYLQAVEND